MNSIICEYFGKNKIEYFGILAYTDCREINAELARRAGFTPKSVILYLLPYYTGETENISRYAASLDYHILLRRVGEGLIALLKENYGDVSALSFGDHSPIDERTAAASLGLGVIGDNKLLINNKYGSYVFIGEVITDIEPGELGASVALPPEGCTHCGACSGACPTGILRGESDACLSSITQKKGELSTYEVNLIKQCGTAWGCDECQSVCPYNASPVPTPIDFFCRDRITRLDYDTVAEMGKSDFSKRAFAWRGKKTILRNLGILED